MNVIKLSTLTAFAWGALLTANAQPGWDFIKKNNFAEARKAFDAELRKDSLNKQALQGVIFTASTSGDDISLSKALSTYTRNYWDDNIYLLFSNDISLGYKTILEKSKFSNRVKLESQIDKANDEFYFRKFDVANKLFDEVNGNYKWTYMGPWVNINGSGHIETFPPETESYNPDKVYIDEAGADMKWVNPPARYNKTGIDFDYNLNEYSSSTFYANTFFKLPAKQTIQIRLKRSEPIKVWLDDDLVYEHNEHIDPEYDNEIIELDVDAGTHRLMVKSSEYTGSGNLGSFDLGYFSDYSFGSNDDGNIVVRLTDTKGVMLQPETFVKADYQKHDYSPKTQGFFVIQNYKDEMAKNPDNLFNYFALERAYKKYGLSKSGEAYFVSYLQDHPDFVLAKYLAFDLYLYNTKKEKAYEVLNDISQEETPIFDVIYEKFLEIDKDNEEEKYFQALEYLHYIAPSNFRVIDLMIDYYESKDEKEKKDEFINGVIKEYPEYKSRLEDRLEKNLDQKRKERKDRFKEESRYEYSYKGDIKEAKKGISKYYYADDYETMIEHYKNKNEISKALSLYDEMIGIQPYRPWLHNKKAELLLEEERFDEAIAEVNKALEFCPNYYDYYEALGDIYFEKKDKEQALRYFKKARHYGLLYGARNAYSLKLKIEKIEGPKQLKKLFKTPAFQDILDQKPEWEKTYKDEESVILMYTTDLVKDKEQHVEQYTRFMVKILTDAGINKWLEYDFSFMGDIKSARIIKSNGAEVVPEGSGGYKVFSNLEVGDLIQIEAAQDYNLSRSEGQELFDYNVLTYEAPIYYAKYEAAMPKDEYFGYLLHKLPDVLVKSTENDFDFYKWEYKNLPKVAFEKNNVDGFDPYANIMVSGLKDWSTISKWYERTTYRKLEPTYEVTAILDSIIKPGMAPREKVEAIYNYLTKAIKYSSVPFLQSGHVPKDPGQTLCSKIGDCKDVATVMVSMLREVGIESHYMLVKTNQYFIQKHLPSKYFDHAIAAYVIDGKVDYLDMTTDFYPYYTLPDMDADAWSLPVTKETTDILQLPNVNIMKDRNFAEIEVNAVLSADRSANLTATAVHTGLGGGTIRERFANFSEDERKNFILDMMGKGIFDNLDLEEYKFQNIDEITQPLKSNYKFSAFNFCDRLSSMLIFRVPFMTAVTMPPSMLSKKRFNALDITEVINVSPSRQKINIVFPAGYDLLEMPKNIVINNKYGTYELKYTRTAQGLTVEKLQSFNESVIFPGEFESFKAFYLQILDADSGKIGLKKKA